MDTALALQLCCFKSKLCNSAFMDTALALQLCYFLERALQLCLYKHSSGLYNCVVSRAILRTLLWLCNYAFMNTALALQLCCFKSNVLDTVLALQLSYSNSFRADHSKLVWRKIELIV